MNKWYLLLDSNNIIQDVVSYEVEGYTEVNLPDLRLPAGINAGWYRWNGTTYVLDEALKAQLMPQDEKLKKLEEQVAVAHDETMTAYLALAEVYEGLLAAEDNIALLTQRIETLETT